ncbi:MULTISPECIES: YafY family protein [unclassified Actinoplanes]|uniref:helix-turn-helix transcriptional regulator n=1 Tax=unclassified Actinoplanes TaxID=2626549 RepID=UPI0005BC012E|nr:MULTISPECIES: YafY family protein [unclassified Actinoplanes]
MNRTGRLYALVEELRAAAPRPVTVAALAARFEVSRRSVQRDLQTLLETGVPVRAVPGRRGGWVIDPAMTLPPIRFTPDEASALVLALAAVGSTVPYSGSVRSALQKIAASLSGPASDVARNLAARVVALPPRPGPAVRGAVEQAITGHAVLRLCYVDSAGRDSEREIEPAGLLTSQGRWYLIGWCRTRRAARGFRLDRILAAAPTGEPAPPRDLAMLLDSAAASATLPDALTPLACATAPAPPASERTAT